MMRTGSGIAHSLRKRLFDPYYRVDAKQSDGGKGLGLSIARDILEAHGSHMESRQHTRQRKHPSRAPANGHN